MKKVIVIY